MLDLDKLYYIMDYSGNYYRTNDKNKFYCMIPVEEAARLVCLLKECREHRREVKDAIVCLDAFQRTVGNGENAVKAKEAIKAIKGLDNRKYNPRKLSLKMLPMIWKNSYILKTK